MNCPNCNSTLTMAERSGVEIDYCPQCRGVWLDRGELDKIIERSAQENTMNPLGNYYAGGHKFKDDKYYKHGRRKSFLGDLFDF